jgi:hypothetical protein
MIPIGVPLFCILKIFVSELIPLEDPQEYLVNKSIRKFVLGWALTSGKILLYII